MFVVISLIAMSLQLLDMDVSPSGALGVCASDNGRLWIWDTDTGENRVHARSILTFCRLTLKCSVIVANSFWL